MENKMMTINKLALEIADEVNGLLKGDEPEPTIFKKALKIAELSK